jgi:hypothetical protein
MDDDEDDTRDWHTPALETARDAIARAITAYAAELARQDDEEAPVIVGWIVAYEGTSIELEQADQAQRQTIVPNGQTISASVGLGTYASRHWD